MATKFVKETDNRGRTYIIEGEQKPGKVFLVKRFICEVQRQETEKETREIADMLLRALVNEEHTTDNTICKKCGKKDHSETGLCGECFKDENGFKL